MQVQISPFDYSKQEELYTTNKNAYLLSVCVFLRKLKTVLRTISTTSTFPARSPKTTNQSVWFPLSHLSKIRNRVTRVLPVSSPLPL
uniref:Uncharacterized protein n=1 Tax=Proboscia inermis TaxID=420281 RepID=A0A7S0CFK7_9STRA